MTLDFQRMWDEMGTLLRNFVELSNFNSFSSYKALFDVEMDSVLFGGKANVCEDLKTKEKWLHQIFKNLSQLVGFDDSEAKSIYEIPSMLSDADSEDLYLGSISKIPYYSRCEINKTQGSLILKESRNLWKNFIENNGDQGKQIILLT